MHEINTLSSYHLPLSTHIMPRPKRTKLAPSSPTARILSLNTSIANTLSSPQTSNHDAENSDDSLGLVKVNKSGLNRRGIARKDVRMSGALAIEDGAGTALKPISGRQRAALSKIVRDAESSKAIVALKKRKEEADARKKEQHNTIPSSMPEVDAVGPRGDPELEPVAFVGTVERVKPVVFPRLQTTPTVESSMLALANFKRRPRQPSILQIGRDEPAEATDSDDLDEFQPDDESTPLHLSRPRSDVQGTPVSHSSSSQKVLSSGSRKRKLTPPEVQTPPSESSVAQLPLSATQTAKPTSMLDSSPNQIPNNDQNIAEPELPVSKSKRPVTPEIWNDVMAPPQSSSPIQKTPPSTRPTRVTKSKATTARKLIRKQSTRKLISKSPALPSSISKSKDTRTLQASKLMTTATLQNLLPRRKRYVHKDAEDEFGLPGSSDVELDNTGLDEDADELSFALPVTKKGTKGKKKEINLPQPKTKAKGKATKNATAAALISTKPSKKQSSTVITPANPTPRKTYARRLSDKENHPKAPQPTSSLLHDHALTLNDNDNDNSSIPDASNPLTLSLSVATDEQQPSPSPSPSTRTTTTTASLAKKQTNKEYGKKTKASSELRDLAQKFREVDRWEMEFEVITASSSSPRDAR